MTVAPAAGADAAARGSQGLLAPASVCSPVSGFGNAAAARRSMTCFTNYARGQKGLKPYRVNRKLNRAAKRKAADIIRCGEFSHTACGRPFTFWMRRSGYMDGRCWTAGENIAWGSGNLGSSRKIFRAWLKSPGHRSAILSRDFRDLGIGLRVGTVSGASGARVWVQHFGAHC